MSNQYEELFCELKETADYERFMEVYKNRFNDHTTVKLIREEITKTEAISMLTDVVFGLIEGKTIDEVTKETKILDDVLHCSFLMAYAEFLAKEDVE